jgi:hypothetical protein
MTVPAAEADLAKAPGFSDYLFILAFFVIGNVGTLWFVRHQSRRASGLIRSLYYITAAPMFWFFSYSAWFWLTDVTANNLWPIVLVMCAIPTALCWLVLNFIVRRGRQSD